MEHTHTAGTTRLRHDIIRFFGWLWLILSPLLILAILYMWFNFKNLEHVPDMAWVCGVFAGMLFFMLGIHLIRDAGANWAYHTYHVLIFVLLNLMIAAIMDDPIGPVSLLVGLVLVLPPYLLAYRRV